MPENKKRNLLTEYAKLKAEKAQGLSKILGGDLADKMGRRETTLRVRANRGGRNGNGKP